MARARRLPPREEEPELDMSSMIDVSFLLLIYFIVTSTLDPKEADVAMKMPTSESSSSTEVTVDQMTINVNGSGHIIANEETLDQDPDDRTVPLLKQKLANYKKGADLTNSQAIVIISADDSASGQRFIDVLNALASVGISNVTITGFQE